LFGTVKKGYYSVSVQFVLLKFVRIACLSLFCVFNYLEYGNGKPGKVLSRAQLNVDEVSFPANETQWIQVKAGSTPTRI